MIELRELLSDDWKIWRELRLAALAEAPYAFGSKLADWTDAPEQKWRDRLELPGARNAVVFSEGTPVGMASAVPNDNIVKLISMWVAPTGRGQGVGDLLMAWFETTARELGADTAELDVVTGNEKAINLYERSGYVVTGTATEVDGDRTIRELIMQKSL